LPSLWEAFPIVLLEAAAANIPVITTPVGSVPSFINSNEGYLVDLNKFKEAMIEVITDYKNAKIKSNLLNKKVSSAYNIKKITLLYENLYKKALE
jgi:glycosyltransferase involved in cell wall biosynthesis